MQWRADENRLSSQHRFVRSPQHMDLEVRGLYKPVVLGGPGLFHGNEVIVSHKARNQLRHFKDRDMLSKAGP